MVQQKRFWEVKPFIIFYAMWRKYQLSRHCYSYHINTYDAFLLFLTVNIPNVTKAQKTLSYAKTTYVSCDI